MDNIVIIGNTVGTTMNPKKIASPSDEQVRDAVDEYLEENPVSGGLTPEQEDQIGTIKKDIETIKKDIGNVEILLGAI